MIEVFGARVRQARHLRRMTATSVVEFAGWSNARQSKIEKTPVVMLSESDVNQLSTLFRFPAAFFSSEPQSRVTADELLFRAPKSMTLGEQDFLATFACLAGDFLGELDGKSKLPRVKLPSVPDWKTGPVAIVDAAARLRHAMGVEHEEPLDDLTYEAERLGVPVIVRRRSAGDWESEFAASPGRARDEKHLGYSTWVGRYRDRPLVVLRESESWERTRFTVAHELGHLVLQALTGRRASEILMLDFDPLVAIPGAERPTDGTDPDAFVAKLRCQQTKVDGVTPTILVEAPVVNVIAEQRAWIRAKYPQLTPKYLFLGLHQHHGQRPRTYESYNVSLGKLDKLHGLTDAAGNPLRFSQTHRLRHTRATELLNDGVPIHVVQRYLGHASPEMTLRYAATLAATAEAEFRKHKKIGAHGAEITINPSDIYDMTQLSLRTDRILPNGVCLLPPVQTCDKGNSCLSCGHFATDVTHLNELIDQRAKTLALIEVRRTQYRARTGRDLTEDNVWIHGRRREIASLDAIIDRIRDDPALTDTGDAVGGAGTTNRLPLLQISTRGSHGSVLRKADPDTAQ